MARAMAHLVAHPMPYPMAYPMAHLKFAFFTNYEEKTRGTSIKSGDGRHVFQ